MKLTDQLQLSILTEVTKNMVESTFNRFQLNRSEYDYSELKDLKLAAEMVGRMDVVYVVEEYLFALNP